MSKSLLIIFAFIGVFACGAVAGGLVSLRISQRVVQKKAVEQLSVQHVRRLQNALTLEPTQQQQIRTLITAWQQDVQAARKNLGAATARFEEQVMKVLNDEQRARYRIIRERQREDERTWGKWLREQREKRDMRDREAKPPREREKAPSTTPRKKPETAPEPMAPEPAAPSSWLDTKPEASPLR